MKVRLRRISAAFLAIMMLLSLTACGAGKNSSKIKLTMYLWDKPMMKELTPWLEAQFPDIDFTFVVGYNTMDFYTDLAQRDKLPDIITCRRFSLNDAAHLSDLLMDLSETNVAGSFYDSYIENYREPDGAIRWLPTCAEVDGYIANVDLFAQHGIPLPTNRAEFTEASQRFAELGIRCYVNDYRMDYSCMEALQGCAIPELMSSAGINWRKAYENETDDVPVGLDKAVWPGVFDAFAQYLQDTGVEPGDVDISFEQMYNGMLEGKTAIVRGTANDCVLLGKQGGINAVMLPYFGETAEDNWLLTYPMFQVAVSSAVEQDARKQDAVMRVLEAMFSEEGQHRTAVNKAVLTYNKNVDIQISDVFSSVMDCINSNHLYIRLASTEMFAISKNVVHKMVSGEYGAEEAYADFNAQLIAGSSDNAAEIVTRQNTAYPYSDDKGGSPAASAVVNTLRSATGSDIAVGYSNVVSGPIYAGDYTTRQLNWLLSGCLTMRQGTLTGAQIWTLMEWLINEKEDGSNPIRHHNLIPVTSGMTYRMRDNGDGTYSLLELTVNGQPLDVSKEYTAAIFGDEQFLEESVYCGCPVPGELKERLGASADDVYQLLCSALAESGQFEAPQEYVSFDGKK